MAGLMSAGGMGAKELLCGDYYQYGDGNAIRAKLYYRTRDGALTDPDVDMTVHGEYLQIKASWEGTSWSKGLEVTAIKSFSGILYTAPSNGVFQASQKVTYSAGALVIPFTSKIGNFVLEIK